MNVVLIIPTGVGAEIGGHAGDANPVAKLLGAVSDKLILHPNVVNASDINEMPANALYVEGSMLDGFLEGRHGLREVRSNRVLVAANPPLRNETINAVSAARATIGMEASILELATPLELIATMESGKATGEVRGWKELVAQVQEREFDALAIASPITVDKEVALKYLREGGVNPWGGVEAKASKLICRQLARPVAHAPVEGDTLKGFNEIVDPRMAAEMVSRCYLHSVLKGLHRAPQMGTELYVDAIGCLVTPIGCVGVPHRACVQRQIPIIVVRENRTVLNEKLPPKARSIFVENYLEAAGVIAAMGIGVDPASVTRPLTETPVRW